jgi:hypothetical protein
MANTPRPGGTWINGDALDAVELNRVEGNTQNASDRLAVVEADPLAAAVKSFAGAAVGQVVAVAQATGGAATAFELYRPGTAALNVLDFGAVPDGDATAGTGTDNYAAFVAALLAVEPIEGAVYVPPGEYRVTNVVPAPSRVTLYGDGPGAVTLFQTTPGTPVIASKSWITGFGGGPTGRAVIRGLTVQGEGTDPASHGVVLRDYYSTIEDVVARQCGGDGVRITASNQAGTVVGFTLVENHYTKILTDQCKGYGFNQDATSPILTDSFITWLVTRGVAGALGGVRIPYSAGWQVRGVHTYGSFAGPAVEMNRMWASILDGAQIEQGWTGIGLRIANYQRAGIIDNIHIAMSASGVGLEATQDQSLYPGNGLVIGSLSIVSSVATTGTAVTWDTNSRPLYISSLQASGENLASLTLLGGSGASSIRVMKDSRVLSKLRDSAASHSLAVNDISVPLCDRANWQSGAGGVQQVVALDVAGQGDFGRWEGILTVSGATNYNGGKSAVWVAHVIVTSKASTDAWSVYVTDLVAPSGFTVAPAVTVAKGTPNGTLTVTFTPTAASVYGAASLLSARD